MRFIRIHRILRILKSFCIYYSCQVTEEERTKEQSALTINSTPAKTKAEYGDPFNEIYPEQRDRDMEEAEEQPQLKG